MATIKVHAVEACKTSDFVIIRGAFLSCYGKRYLKDSMKIIQSIPINIGPRRYVKSEGTYPVLM